MKRIKPVVLIVGLALFSCQGTDNKSTFNTSENTLVSSEDKQQIQDLIRRMYKWQETQKPAYDDLITDSKDSMYIGFESERLKQHIDLLRSTNFFSSGFIDNYSKIYTTLDKKLRKGEMKWLVGDLPPFGNGANPWCNCQDSPDNYWQMMTVQNFSFEHHVVTFTWSWGDNFEYHAKAIKQQGRWKIAYLEGFNYNEFITMDNKTDYLQTKYPDGYLDHYLAMFYSQSYEPTPENFSTFNKLYIQIEGEEAFTALKKELRQITLNNDTDAYLNVAKEYGIKHFGSAQLKEMIHAIEHFNLEK